MRYSFALATAATLASIATARDVPQNLRDLISSVTQQGSCQNVLQGGFFSESGDAQDTSYCGDHLESDGIIYIQGTGGKLTNMDTDCDGVAGGTGDDGRCHFGEDGNDDQSETSFGSMIQGHGSQSELNAFVHTYVVLGNVGENEDGSSNKPGYTTFVPQSVGVQPMSLVAVVCGDNQDKLFYGVWGDENGDDDIPLVGEASISMATLCCGTDVSSDSGCGDENNFMYIGFTGDAAVALDTANWDAGSAEEFEESLATLGQGLIEKIGGGNGGSTPPPTTTTTAPSGPTSSPPSQTCAWDGHCQGATCSTDDDCSDPWSCVSGTCN